MFFGLNGRSVRIENGVGFSSPLDSCKPSHLIDDDSRRGGVPVFKRETLKPLFTRTCDRLTTARSPNLPAENCSFPICINPFKKVPEQTIRAPVFNVPPFRKTTLETRPLSTEKSTASS